MRPNARVISLIVLTFLLTTTALAAEWKRITDPPAAPQTMLLLTNGEIMTLTSDRGPNMWMPDRSQVWMRLSPDPKGDYSNGSWRFTAPMSIPRLFFASNIVRDTRLIVIGGEYSGIDLQHPNWTRAGEAYDPAIDIWTAIAPYPEQQFGDVPTMLLDGDRILAGSLLTRNTWVYHYTTDTWEQNPIPKFYNDQSDEETWVKLPGGRILTYDLFQSIRIPNGQFAEIFDPVANSWLPASPTDGTAAGFIPQLSDDSIRFELGGSLLQRPQRMRHRNGTPRKSSILVPRAIPPSITLRATNGGQDQTFLVRQKASRACSEPMTPRRQNCLAGTLSLPPMQDRSEARSRR